MGELPKCHVLLNILVSPAGLGSFSTNPVTTRNYGQTFRDMTFTEVNQVLFWEFYGGSKWGRKFCRYLHPVCVGSSPSRTCGVRDTSFGRN